MEAKYFRSAPMFRRWLERHHERAEAILVCFYKKDSGNASITWPESVDEALCFGWIDGVRKRVDGSSYTIRFTPRRKGSVWSAVNIKRAQALIEDGRMRPAGLAAFAARRAKRSGVYSYEQRPKALVEPYAGMLAKNEAALQFFTRQAPSYQRAATWWVISAKKEETRQKRTETLIELSASGKKIPQFIVERKPNRVTPRRSSG